MVYDIHGIDHCQDDAIQALSYIALVKHLLIRNVDRCEVCDVSMGEQRIAKVIDQ